MFKKLWNDPVWSKVIAGGILFVFALVPTYYLNWWPAIASFGSTCWAFILASTSVANWLLGLLILTAIPTVGLLVVAVWFHFFPEDPGPSWAAYRSDELLGLKWRWDYTNGIEFSDPVPFCPHCDFQVNPREANAYRAIDRIYFACDHCGRDLRTFEESFDALVHKIRRLIQMKLRNNLWPKPEET